MNKYDRRQNYFHSPTFKRCSSVGGGEVTNLPALSSKLSRQQELSKAMSGAADKINT